RRARGRGRRVSAGPADGGLRASSASSMGSCYTRTTCRLCGSAELALVLDLGEMALAGAFVRPDQFAAEEKFPLRVSFCERCHLLQVIDVLPAETLFSNYFYHSSAIGTLRSHFTELAHEIADRWATAPGALAVEIGCNDGVLLDPLVARGVRAVGVEPAANIAATARAKGLQIENRFFSTEAARDIRERYGPASVILANNVFAHLDAMDDVVGGIAHLLDGDGVFITENHYLGSVIEELQYDMIYHEHMSYYSLLPLERFFAQFGLVVVDVRPIPIHAGSMRFYVRHAGHPVSPAVEELRQAERSRGYDRLETFTTYADRVAGRRADLLALLRRLAGEGKRVAGYGASGRANTIIQYCGIGHDLMEYVVDDAPYKQGLYTPGSHFRIRPGTALQEDRPDYVLLFAWAFADEVRRRNPEYFGSGGRMIVPLPDVRVLD
ncbi:MAG TPA: class I SAM-dependent methyltransferase, partial [Longimicrobium sp.]|nr:class I SAM-dependent methyltransferase [Longimicrobium sp.]